MKKLNLLLGVASAVALVGVGYSAFLFEDETVSTNKETITANVTFHPAYEAGTTFEFLKNTDKFEIHLDQAEGNGHGIHIVKDHSTGYPDKGKPYEIEYKYTITVPNVHSEYITEVTNRLKEYTINITGELFSTNSQVLEYLALQGVNNYDASNVEVIQTEGTDDSVEGEKNLSIEVTGIYKVAISYKEGKEPKNMNEYNTMKSALGDSPTITITLTSSATSSVDKTIE